MEAFLILAAVLILGPIFLPIPIVLWGRDGARNNFVRITMKAKNYYTDLTRPAVFAQELVEWWFKWVVAMILAIPLELLARPLDNTIVHLAIPIFTYAWSVPGQKLVEYIGHAVECAQYRKKDAIGAALYFCQEAGRMRLGYGDLFKNDTRIVHNLWRLQPIARVLLRLFGYRISRVDSI